MKTKTISFDLETAKKIQAGEIEGRLLMKSYKSEETYPVIILTCDAVHNRNIRGSIDIVVLVQFEYGDVAMQFNSDGYGLDVHGNDVRLLVELPEEAPKHEFESFDPFDKVLVRDADSDFWRASFFSHISDGWYVCVGEVWKQCIPYKGNEHLVGTTYKPENLC